MRLHILSDLHLEFEPFTPPAIEADAVILAGDVSTGRNGLKWALKTFPNRPVVYVLGNHEFYGQKLQKLIKELQELADGTNINLLENGSCSIGDVVFLGATLWIDFALNGNPVVSEVVNQTSMNDYRRIRTLPRYRRLKPSDTRRLHMESRRWLEDQAFAHKRQKVVVVTHHAPSRESIPPAFAGSMAISTIAAITRWAKHACWPTRGVIRRSPDRVLILDRKSTRPNFSHANISYAV